MIRYVVLLRGINVGTGRKVPMADLKKQCESLGLKNVQTYIQSGNLIFELETTGTDFYVGNPLAKGIFGDFWFRDSGADSYF